MADYAHVYILASKRNGTLYVGVTTELRSRIYQHREGVVDRFTKRYGVKLLVHVEGFADVRDATAREKALKAWKRNWKLDLIERDNPDWRDLWFDINA